MITTDNKSIRIVQTVDLMALREVVLDEDGHIWSHSKENELETTT